MYVKTYNHKVLVGIFSVKNSTLKHIKYKTAQQVREKIIHIKMTEKNTENDQSWDRRRYRSDDGRERALQ